MKILKGETFNMVPQALTFQEEAGLTLLPTYRALCDFSAAEMLELYKSNLNTQTFIAFGEWGVQHRFFVAEPDGPMGGPGFLFSITGARGQ